MIISSFWANDLGDILGFSVTSGAIIIFAVIFLVIGYLGFVSFCLDYVKDSNNKYLNYTLYILSFLMLLGMIKLSTWGYGWGYESYTPRWMHSTVPRYYPSSASNAGWNIVMFIGIVSILISGIFHLSVNEIKKSIISRKDLKENPYLKLNKKGIYSIARIIEIEDISPNSCWVTYVFTWRDVQYRNRIARPKTKRNGAFDMYEIDTLLFVQFMKNDPSNNMLTDQLMSKSLTLVDIPKKGWKRRDYLGFTGH